MISKNVAVIVVIALAVCAAGGAAFFLTNSGNDSNSTECTITYELNGGTADESSPTSYIEGSTGELGTPTRFSDDYEHTFLGWYTDSALTQRIEKITSDIKGDLKLYASWDERAYSISYNLNGGTADPDSPSSYVYGKETDLGTPTRSSEDCYYIFSGWYTDSNLTQKIETISSTTAGNIKLFASWTGPIYSITYELNGGTADPDAPSSYVYGSEYELYVPVKSTKGHDCIFLGWYTDSALTEEIEAITSTTSGNLTLFASWTGPIYSITYELNGGTADPDSPLTYIHGDVTDLGCPTNGNMSFMGWYLDEECTDLLLYIDADVSGDLELYALWDDTIVGHGVRYDLGLTYTSSTSTSEYTGYYECTYLAVDDEKGSLRHTVLSLTNSYGKSSSSDDTKWNSDDGDYNETLEEDITVTVNGWTFVCDKVTFVSKDGNSTEVQYIIYDWLAVMIDSVVKETGYTMNYRYILSDMLSAEVPETCALAVYAQDGITVTCPSELRYGFDAEFTAAADSGKTFKGWYDGEGNLLSEDTVYYIDIVLSDLVIFAYSTSDYDLRYSLDTQFSVDSDLSDPVWTLVSSSEEITSQTGDTFTYTFTDKSAYTLLLDGKDESGNDVGKFYLLVVDYVLTRTYDWTFNDVDYSVTLDIDYCDYYYYLTDDIARRQGTMAHNMEFVTYEDKYVVQIAEYINSATSSLSDEERVNVLLCFTQTLPYKYDSVSKGQDEYWKYPLETLYEYNGDCEDTSILFCAIGTAMGYDTAFMLFSGHAVAAINIEDLGYTVEDNISAKQWLFNKTYYFNADGKDETYAYRDSVYDKSRYYLYCETSLEDYLIGKVSSVRFSSANVQSVCPILSGSE